MIQPCECVQRSQGSSISILARVAKHCAGTYIRDGPSLITQQRTKAEIAIVGKATIHPDDDRNQFPVETAALLSDAGIRLLTP